MSLLSRRKGREFHTYWTENLGPKFLKAFAAESAGKCGRCRCPDASACRRGTWSRRFRRGGIRPTFSFVLAKDKVNCPEGKRGAPGGKRAAPGTKENRLFIGLLVRPEQMGLVSSSCAEPLALPVRSRRSCPASNNLLVQIGLLCATAPLPLSGQKKNVYAPVGRSILRMLGLAAAAQEGPRVLFAPSGLHPMSQMRPKRHGSAGRGAQPETAKQITAQCSHRAASLFFSYTGRGAFSFLEKENGGKRRSAAGGGASEPLSRMRRDWQA